MTVPPADSGRFTAPTGPGPSTAPLTAPASGSPTTAAAASAPASRTTGGQAAATEEPSPGALATLDDVSVHLSGRLIWTGATLSLSAGSVTAVLGPNGSGKSTLLRLLLGLVPASGGTVRVLDRPPQRGNPAIGYVPQRRSLDPDLPVRGRDLVRLGLDGNRWGLPLRGRPGAHRALVREAIDSVDAAGYADRAIGRLSGGEQQRLLLAQALVSRPQLLFLDEPFTSLDLRNQVAISELVTEIARARRLGVLMVTHDINPILPVVDQVIYVARGQVAVGTPGEVITTDSLTHLYDAPVEVVRDSRGRLFVVGLENETAHPHDHHHDHPDDHFHDHASGSPPAHPRGGGPPSR